MLIDKVFPNPENPRTISDFKLGKLMESILVFPQMLKIRPLVLNDDDIILGGNQRYSCLKALMGWEQQQIHDALENQIKFTMSSAEDQDSLLKFWEDWKKKGKITFCRASEMTPAEQKRFMILDNVNFGEDDLEIMSAEYDVEKIQNMVGDIPQAMFDYSDRMNDEGLEIAMSPMNYLSCAYVKAVVSDEEMAEIQEIYDAFVAEKLDINFLTYLLHEEEAE